MQKTVVEVASEAGNKASFGNVYLLFTVGVPGLGKSYLVNSLVQYLNKIPDHFANICTSDEVRSKVLADYYSAHNVDVSKLSQEEIYKIESDNALETRAKLFEQVKEHLGSLHASGKSNCFFIMDKNFCSNQLIQLAQEQAKQVFTGWNLHHGVFVPDIFAEDDDRSFYPFKLETILIGLERSLTRKVHLTMKYGPVHSLLSFTSCLQSQLKDAFDEKFPPTVYKRIQVHYYSQEIVEKGKANPVLQPLIEKLREIVNDLVSKKRLVPEACDELVHIVEQLEPMNAFETPGESGLTQLVDRIKKTT